MTMIAQFELIRENETFALLLPQLPQQCITRTRFRHHGPRKWRTELETIPQVKRIEVSRARAHSIAKKAHRDNRVISYPLDGRSCEWQMVIKAVQ